MINAIDFIKLKITMRDVLSKYGYSTSEHRMKCPLHGGDGKNFEFRENSYMCFSRCGHGDVISFVQKFFNLSFKDTLRRIDADFCLGIYSKPKLKDFRQAQKQLKEKKQQEEAKLSEKRDIEEQYWTIYDEYVRLDKNLRTFAPKSFSEELHDLYVEALQKIDYQKYLLELAIERINKQ